MQRILLFAGRGLAMLGIGFISLFALDVFGMEGSLAWRLGGVLVHLAPSFVLAGILAVAWRWPALGGALFIAAGLSPGPAQQSRGDQPAAGRAVPARGGGLHPWTQGGAPAPLRAGSFGRAVGPDGGGPDGGAPPGPPAVTRRCAG
ncbi:DUF7670 domain-containing protein [Brevundimonas viscosa]|uniref:DUF7670 domain-containing protein n=1 Tax=Brevundimonas viscosa TaxID=871741 RepID=UPI000B8385F1|nr:hypothetical protein [Brevundimonas viscosa]